jgi:hypothetical protein
VTAYKHRQQHRFHTLRFGPRHFYRHHVKQEGHPHQSRAAIASRRRKQFLLVLGGLVVLIVVFGLMGLSAYHSALRAKQSLDAAKAVISADLSDKQIFLSSSGRAKLGADIQTVETDANSASGTLHGSLGMRVFGYVPILNDQPNGIVSLVADVRTTAVTASDLLQRVNTLVDQSVGTTVSLTALQSLQRSVASAQTTMSQLNRPEGDLIGPLATARREFDVDIAKITTDLSRGNQTLAYALPFLGADGSRTYLIAGENNAEMRDQGDVLSLALMNARNGTFDVNTIGSVDNIEPSRPVDVSVPAGTNRIFGGYLPTSLWQSVNASADFPLSGQIMQAMFAQVQGAHVNGVIALDVPALESLLALTGPVSVPGITDPISAQNVASVILHDQYAQFPPGSAQAQRHDNIAAVADATVKLMKSEHIDLAALGNALASDVAGRHLMVWDETPRYERTVAAIGASGSIDSTAPSRTFHLAVENSTATKLDYYVQPSENVQVHVTSNGDALVNTTVTLTNNTPNGLGPTFQTGPDGINSFTPGQYVSNVVLWSPRGSITPGSTPESGLRLSQTQASVLPQQSQTVSFTSIIPHAVENGHLALRFVPQSRLTPVSFHLGIVAPGWQLDGPQTESTTLANSSEFSWNLTK